MCILRVMHILTSYRKSKGISQRAFAEAVDVDQSIVSRLETGDMRPSLSLALRIDKETSGAVPVTTWAEANPSLAPQKQVGEAAAQ